MKVKGKVLPELRSEDFGYLTLHPNGTAVMGRDWPDIVMFYPGDDPYLVRLAKKRMSYRYATWSPSGDNICFEQKRVYSFTPDIAIATSAGENVSVLGESSQRGRCFGVLGWRAVP